MTRRLIPTAAASLLVVAAPVAAQDLPACARYPVSEASYSCFCDPDAPAGSVWGSGPYTADSDLCAAARHAGMLGAEGGPILALRVDGMAEFPASTQNGVTTSRWGRYDPAVIFEQPVDISQPLPDEGGPLELCAGLVPDEIETRCFCEPGAGTGAAVWGSSPYTSDSDLCAAARHSEVIGLNGGEISVIRLPGLTGYRASERNGIQTMEWGEYGESFIVNAN